MEFKDFLDEAIAASKRKGMIHLEKAKPSEFLELVREIASKHKGVLKDVKVSLKVDGAGIRFGKDAMGRFFFETSRSGPIQQSKAFTTFAANKGGDVVRAAHYDDMYEAIKSSNLWKDLPKDSKVIAEIMYNPMAEFIGDKVKFVSVNYDKSKLGSLMTIIPFEVVSASSGISFGGDKIIEDLIKKSTSEIKVVSPNIGNLNLNIDTIINPIHMLSQDVDDVLASRKAIDKDKKLFYTTMIQDVKNQLARYILDHPIEGKDMFGDEIEGLVLDLGGKQFKVTTQDFKDSKKKVSEAVYAGNIGIMELVKFYNTAPEDIASKVKKLIAAGKQSDAWAIIEKYLGIKMHKSVLL